jgi:UDP-N-acetylglucosamine diphosphorylase/glucosamine-1-phosphate N-acetyltransferase
LKTGEHDRVASAIILAAGEGQRLKPFTRYKPKVMIPIANHPILQYVVEALEKNGIRDIVIVVGYRREQIYDFFGAGEKFGVNIEYVVQEQQIGTAHALKQASDKVADDFLVIAGDNIVDTGIIGGLQGDCRPCMVLKEQENISKYGVVVIEDGMVRQILEKPARAPTNLVNTGIYRLNREVFDYIGEETRLTAVLQRMVNDGRGIAACKTDGIWLDVVYPWDILKLNSLALQTIPPSMAGQVEEGVVIKGPVSIGKGSVIRSNTYIVGPAAIGSGCEVGPSVCVFPGTSIGNNVSIFPFSELRNSVIADGAQIGAGSAIHNSVIDKNCVIGGRFTATSGTAEVKVEGEHHKVTVGAMLGEGCLIDDNVTVRPGVIVGNGARVAALNVIRNSLPDDCLVV